MRRRRQRALISGKLQARRKAEARPRGDAPAADMGVETGDGTEVWAAARRAGWAHQARGLPT